jgi:hypothetical protein
MLRPIALGDTRFVVPSLVRSTADVALGPQAIALLPTPAHLVAVLSSLARQSPLTATLGKARAFFVQLDRGAAQVALRFKSRGLRVLDRVAALCRLQGGQLFTGEDTAFVRMRDAGATLGYDAIELSNATGCVLYDSPLPKVITRWTDLDLPGLIQRLSLIPHPQEQLDRPLYLTTPPALARRLARWLESRAAKVQAAFIERSDGPRVLFEARHVPAGLLPLLYGLPRVDAWRRVHPRIFVQAAYRHPLALANAAGLLPGAAWRFFGAHGHETCVPAVTFAPVADLGLAPQALTWPQAADTVSSADRWGVRVARFSPFEPIPIRLHTGARTLGDIAGRLLTGPAARDTLAALIYRVAPSQLAQWQIVAWPDHILLMGRDLPPVGDPLRRCTPSLLIGAKARLVPDPGQAALDQLVLQQGQEGVITPHGAWRWARTSAAPVTRRLCVLNGIVDLPAPDGRGLAAPQVEAVDTSVFGLFWHEVTG